MRFRILKKNLFVALGLSLIFVTVMFSTRVLISGDNTSSVVHENVLPGDTTVQSDSVQNMKTSVYNGTYNQNIQNRDTFSGEPQLVIVIQVLNRPTYLKILIKSLENAA